MENWIRDPGRFILRITLRASRKKYMFSIASFDNLFRPGLVQHLIFYKHLNKTKVQTICYENEELSSIKCSSSDFLICFIIRIINFMFSISQSVE